MEVSGKFSVRIVVCTIEFSVFKICVTEIGVIEIGAAKVGAVQVSAFEIGSGKVGTVEVSVLEIRTPKVVLDENSLPGFVPLHDFFPWIGVTAERKDDCQYEQNYDAHFQPLYRYT